MTDEDRDEARASATAPLPSGLVGRALEETNGGKYDTLNNRVLNMSVFMFMMTAHETPLRQPVEDLDSMANAAADRAGWVRRYGVFPAMRYKAAVMRSLTGLFRRWCAEPAGEDCSEAESSILRMVAGPRLVFTRAAPLFLDGSFRVEAAILDAEEGPLARSGKRLAAWERATVTYRHHVTFTRESAAYAFWRLVLDPGCGGHRFECPRAEDPDRQCRCDAGKLIRPALEFPPLVEWERT